MLSAEILAEVSGNDNLNEGEAEEKEEEITQDFNESARRLSIML